VEGSGVVDDPFRPGEHDRVRQRDVGAGPAEAEHELAELDAIAAVVVGGTLLIGGRGTITGTVFGVLIFATLSNVFVQNNLTSSVQAVAKGVIIVVAVLLQQRFAKPVGRQT
jgi:ribose transport system permease protein